ncbi:MULTISPECIES: ribonuclease HII [unclassified Cellulophaga]|uniref:ribonuclease HII n=1 Tax=unclassified Cellulophaga TaxID=2634405 RepID=UPI0026E24D1C|nr:MULTISPECIES: ribonuclease HII [unclassified Cellulophaga]MDO6491955.1 ribonuclease HII [Cellulophaga sp. 2_MG-2023]MDO6495390.1 ribonuclease HII [Cellulophaga sp. 3_MG-2023]
MKLKIAALFLIICCIGCTNIQQTKTSILDYLPANTNTVLKINDYNSLTSNIKNNELLSFFTNSNQLKGFKRATNVLNHIKPNTKGLLAFITNDSTTTDFYFVTKDSINLASLDSISTSTNISANNRTYKEYKLDSIPYYSVKDNKFTIFSSDKNLIESTLNKSNTNKNKDVRKLYQASNNNKTATLFLQQKNSPFLKNTIQKDSLKERKNTTWVSLDINAKQDQLNLAGVTMSNDSILNFLSLFKNTTAVANRAQEYAPQQTEAITSYTFTNYNIFAKNRKNYLSKDIKIDSVFNTVEEIAIITIKSKKAILLQTFGADNIDEYLSTYKKASNKDNPIITLNNNTVLIDIFNPLIQEFSANYYTILGNAFIFTEEIETLQDIISNYKAGTTFNKTPLYTSATETMAKQSSILEIGNSKKLEKTIISKFSKGNNKPNLDNYFYARQLVADANFYHTNITIQKINKATKANTTVPIFTVQLDNDLATEPQFVENHRNNKKEIIVQDIENNLYLISTDGKVLWKKQLEGKIQGKIAQVDLYKNGRLQFAFTTSNQFLILDRNGETVEPFSITYDGGNLNALAVFDYENNKNYRFVVTQDKKVFMYNAKAEIVTGFKYTEASSSIIKKPNHFVVGNKDYLVFMLEDGSLKILNRVGKVRVKTNNKIPFSNNDVVLFKNKFTVTDTTAVLHQIATNGKTSASKFNLIKEHGLDATTNTLVLMDQNTITIKGKKVTLDLGMYSKPKIFYINNKIYVSVTDLQNQKIYLFDSNAATIQNFPVYGSSLIDLADIDNDKKLELVAKDLDNSLIVYKIN